MTAALALLLGALVAGRVAPALLGRVDLTRVDPLAVLTGWLLSAAGVLAATVAGVALLLLPGHGNGTSMASAIHGCLEAISHGTSPRTEELAGLFGALTVAALVVRFVVMGVLAARRRARTGREHLSTLRIAARCDEASPTTWWLDHAEPLAFSLAHGAGVIVATEGLARRLPAPEVRAVLAHERAHLRRRHHLLLTWVGALAKALPFLPLFRQAPAAVRELVELDADVSAVRTCGSEVVRRALLGVTGHGTPEGTLAMARDSVDLRLARLATGRVPIGRFRRSLACGGAAAAAAALPVVTGSVLLLGVAMVACLLSGG